MFQHLRASVILTQLRLSLLDRCLRFGLPDDVGSPLGFEQFLDLGGLGDDFALEVIGEVFDNDKLEGEFFGDGWFGRHREPHE